MNIRTKIGIGVVSLVALGGSALTVGMSSAMAASPHSTVASATPLVTETVQTGDTGPNVQSGSQSGTRDSTIDVSGGASEEVSAVGEGATVADAPGGVNVDSQATGAQ